MSQKQTIPLPASISEAYHPGIAKDLATTCRVFLRDCPPNPEYFSIYIRLYRHLGYVVDPRELSSRCVPEEHQLLITVSGVSTEHEDLRGGLVQNPWSHRKYRYSVGARRWMEVPDAV